MMDDVMKWKHLVLYWPFVRGIPQSPVYSLHKRPAMQHLDVSFDVRYHLFIISPYNEVVVGYIGFTQSVRLSVSLSRIPCPLCSTYSFGWIHFIFIHLMKQLQKVSCVYSFLKKFQNVNIWQIFVICNVDFVLFWLGIWVGNHGVAVGISECRCSSCSYYLCIVSSGPFY